MHGPLVLNELSGQKASEEREQKPVFTMSAKSQKPHSGFIPAGNPVNVDALFGLGRPQGLKTTHWLFWMSTA